MKSLGRIGWEKLCKMLNAPHSDSDWELLAQLSPSFCSAWELAAQALIEEHEARSCAQTEPQIGAKRSVDYSAITRGLSG